MNKLSKKIILLNFFFAIIFPAILEAQALDEVLRSLSTSKSMQDSFEDKQIKDPWLPPHTNLSKLFTQRGKGMLQTLDWLGDFAQTEFRVGAKMYKRVDEYSELKVSYQSRKDNNELFLTILVAHPKYIDLINTGLVKAFSSIEPPGLSVEAFNKLEIKNEECYLYHHRDGGCSLLYKLPKHSLLNIYSKDCTDNSRLTALAELLTIDRLKEKLES